MPGHPALLLLGVALLSQDACAENGSAGSRYVATCVPAASVARIHQELAPHLGAEVQTFHAAAPTMFADLVLAAKGAEAKCLAFSEPKNEESWTSEKFVAEHNLTLVSPATDQAYANESYLLVAKINVARGSPVLAACVPMRAGANGTHEHFLKMLYPRLFGDLVLSRQGPYKACLEAMSEVNRGHSLAAGQPFEEAGPDSIPELSTSKQEPDIQGTLYIFQNSLQEKLWQEPQEPDISHAPISGWSRSASPALVLGLALPPVFVFTLLASLAFRAWKQRSTQARNSPATGLDGIQLLTEAGKE